MRKLSRSDKKMIFMQLYYWIIADSGYFWLIKTLLITNNLQFYVIIASSWIKICFAIYFSMSELIFLGALALQFDAFLAFELLFKSILLPSNWQSWNNWKIKLVRFSRLVPWPLDIGSVREVTLDSEIRLLNLKIFG